VIKTALTLGIWLSLLSGCGAVKGALKPWVCDCPPAEQTCSEDGTVLASAEQPILESNLREETESDSQSEPEEVPESTAPRTVVDPFTDAVVTPASPGWPELSASVGLPSELPADALVLRGNFDRRGETEAVMVEPGNRLSIFGTSRRRLDITLNEDFSRPEIAKIWGRTSAAATLVSDEVSEIVVVGLDSSGEIEVVTLSIYKVFGDDIGRVFTTEIGRVGPEGITKTAEIEFLGGRRNIAIRRTPLDASGVPDPGRAEIYEWNKWEGMFRMPAPPPTAPKRS
jgi:hypothetical protein